jgi:hypothetical protein
MEALYGAGTAALFVTFLAVVARLLVLILLDR